MYVIYQFLILLAFSNIVKLQCKDGRSKFKFSHQLLQQTVNTEIQVREEITEMIDIQTVKHYHVILTCSFYVL